MDNRNNTVAYHVRRLEESDPRQAYKQNRDMWTLEKLAITIEDNGLQRTADSHARKKKTQGPLDSILEKIKSLPSPWSNILLIVLTV